MGPHENGGARDGKGAQRWAIYLRVSTADQSVDLQKRELLDYASRRGWEVVLYQDTASGTHSNRKMLQKLLVDAKARRIDGIAVYRMDRLFRSLKDAVITLNLLTELGILFFSLKDQIDLTTSSGRLLAGMLAVFAEFEASLIKTRVISGLSAARARGVRLGRPIKVNEEIRSEVIALRESGNSIRQIEKIINRKISRTSIERIVAGISTDSKTKTEKGV